MYEAEIKLVVANPVHVRSLLDSQANGEDEEYADQYFTHEILVPTESARELRVREIRRQGSKEAFLTFKNEVVDAATQSKREYETQVVEADGITRLLEAMGFALDIQFVKNCINWRLKRGPYEILATLVSVPELSGHYLELEALVKEKSSVEHAIMTLRHLARELELDQGDETTETYTGTVRSARGK